MTALAVVVVALLATPVIAEERDPLTPPPLDRYVRWGPLRVQPGLVVRDVGYDSNVFNTPEGEGDYRATLAPRLRGLVLFGDRAFLTLNEELRYTAYANNGQLDYWDQVGEARLTVPFGRIGAWIDAEYDRIRESPLDAEDIRPVRERLLLGSGIVARIGWRTSVEFGRRVAELDNFDDDFGRTDISIGDRLDRLETEWRLRARYRAFGRSTLTLDVLDGSIEFVTPNVEGQPGFDRDTKERRFVPGIEIGDGGRVSGAVRIGFVDLDAAGAEIRDYAGLAGDAEIEVRPLPRLTARLTADRRVEFTVAAGGGYLTYDGAEVSGLYRLSGWLATEAGVDVGRLEIPGTDRRDDLERIFVGARVRLPAALGGSEVEYRLRVGRANRTSNLPRFDRERTFVSISADVGL